MFPLPPPRADAPRHHSCYLDPSFSSSSPSSTPVTECSPPPPGISLHHGILVEPMLYCLVTSTGCDGEAAPGAWCRSECGPHYHRGPESSDGANVTATCLDDGAWDVVLFESCIPRQVCLPSPAPEHGAAEGDCGGLLGDECGYRCDAGFLLVGSPIAVCAVAVEGPAATSTSYASCPMGHWFEPPRDLWLDGEDLGITCSEASAPTSHPGACNW